MAWDIRGKTILITGATSGIGLEASVELARLGARVVMVGRDPGRTEAAVADVRARSGSSEVSHLLCDFSFQAAIRELAAAFLARHDRLHVLVNNAGGVNKTRGLTVDGIEMTFAVNHLGYFLLTNLLCDLLVRSAPARVVTVASVSHRRGTLDFDDLGFERGGYAIMRAYGRSKLANVLFAAELSRRLAGTGVTSNSLHPGSVATNIWSGAPLWAKPIINIVWRPFFISPQKGAATIVQLAARPELEGVTGKYFEEGRLVAPSAPAQDETLAKRLWKVSADMVGLS
ncbi:MAG TPA: SDR family oxidoreductase [Thermoanaerobaculia bacterium]|jgi:NAD(P)-dependent dehydrogenase (short-subunit alcohol dehydrogenase family)|nr:SDR family oxidoreductase [Thermoanaerobaculia bacterium]